MTRDRSESESRLKEKTVQVRELMEKTQSLEKRMTISSENQRVSLRNNSRNTTSLGEE